jgi:drug/metabolite transporter (DMT)-like permease
MSSQSPVSAVSPASEERLGFLFVFLAALCWSLGGVIARFVEADDPWTSIFWRSVWAATFLIGYMVWRDGMRGTIALFRNMGLPGLAVAGCFTIATSSFVIALAHTTVANILLIQAGAPLFAALMAFVVLGEKVSAPTWVAIAAVLAGVGVMVSDSFAGSVSAFGDGLALLIVLVFSIATVLTRRFSHVRMTPALCLGAILAGALSATQASSFIVSPSDMAFLVAFGAVNLGLGAAFFATGARMIPAAYAALLGTFEPLLGPIWVWLVHAEVPASRTLMGGAIVFTALLLHIAMQFRRLSKPARPGAAGISSPS